MPGRRGAWSQVAFDPSQIVGQTGDLFPMATLGEEIWKNGKLYIYGKFDNGNNNVAAVVGQVAYWADWDNAVFTSDFPFSLGGGTELCFVAGVFLYVMTDLRFGWIQKQGSHPAVKVNATGAPGQLLIPSTTSGQLTTVATGAVTAAQAGAQVVGRQTANAVGGFAAAVLQIL
jgi:hypothetical protein